MNLEELKARRQETLSIPIGGTPWVIGRIMADQDPAKLFTDETKAAGVDEGDNPAARTFYARLLKLCLMNGTGLLFAEQSVNDVLALLTWHELSTLGQAALEFNGLGDNAKKN